MTWNPSRERGRRDLLIAGAGGGAVVLLLVVLLSQRDCGPGPETPGEIPVTWTLRQAGAGQPPLPPVAPGRDLSLYLDVSQPMGGFLPPASRAQELSGFRAVVQLTQDHLMSVAGGGATRVQWFGVAADADPLPGAPRLERSLFRGRETRLDRALERLRRSLTEGKVAAAALVTDLNASDGLTGALGALRPLSAWVESPEVRSGAFHLGLLGVRAPYWGVPGHGCAAHGDLGCWFSERRNAYLPLSRVAQAPFYVLVMGRGQEAVTEIGERLRRGAENLGLKPQWELLSAPPSATAQGKCQLAETGHDGESPQQSALARDASGSWQCVQDDRIELSCELPPEIALAAPRLEASWHEPGVELPKAEAAAAGDPSGSGGPRPRLRLILHCEQLRDHPPAGPLSLRAVGFQPPIPARWASWTSVTDEREEDLDKTPGLAYFVDRIRLRPGAVEVRSSPLLRMSGGAERR